MAIKFKNIRNNEIRVAESEPLISALFNSSDKGPNALVGQDFGWRLAPEVVVEMKRIISNPDRVQEVANRFRKPFDEVSETDVLKFISDNTSVKDAPVAIEGDYENDYRDEIRRLENAQPESKLEAALIEAEEWGVDVTPYNGSLGLIKAAIGRAKKASQALDNV